MSRSSCHGRAAVTATADMISHALRRATVRKPLSLTPPGSVARVGHQSPTGFTEHSIFPVALPAIRALAAARVPALSPEDNLIIERIRSQETVIDSIDTDKMLITYAPAIVQDHGKHQKRLAPEELRRALLAVDLVAKGYRSEHITLEKVCNVGRSSSPRLDLLL